jgi:hypothetical protein
MTRFRGHAATALAAALVLGVVASSAALTPKKGLYYGDSKEPFKEVYFRVGAGGTEIRHFEAVAAARCPTGVRVEKPIEVDDSGRFHFEGKADNTDGVGRKRVEVKGKFVSETKARGTFINQGCDKYDFTARRE